MTHELLNHKANCRLCFQRISSSRNILKITERVQQKFFSLTNIELKSSEKFSNSICKPCIKALNESSEFQHKMIDNQRRLYAFESDIEIQIVKTEPIDSQLIQLQEIKIEDVIPMKTEVFEDPWTEDFQMPDSEEASRPPSPVIGSAVTRESDTVDYVEEGTDDEVATKNGKKTKNTRMKYPLEQLFNAVEAVALGELSFGAASKKFAVPLGTIRRRFHSDYYLLTDQEELQVKLYVNKRTEFGIRSSDEDIEKFILFRLLCKRRGKDRVKIRTLSSTWVSFFRKRHSDMNILENNVDVEFSCDLCGFSIKEKKKLRTHMELHTKKKPNLKPRSRNTQQYAPDAFEQAMKAFSDGMSMRGAARLHNINHMTFFNYKNAATRKENGKEHEPDIFKCSFCERFFYFESTRRSHEVTKHLAPVGEFPCTVCGKVFKTEPQLKSHTNNAHVKRTYDCLACGDVSDSRAKLRTHRLMHREEVACHVCGKMLKGGVTMTKHMKNHAPADKYKCTFEGCSQTFRKKESLNYHIRYTHSPIDESVKCTKCDSTFPNAFKLKRHDERSHVVPRFYCAVDGCSYKSTRKEYLKLHLRNHKDIDVKFKDELIMNVRAKKIES